jgi:hypothetical protein
MNGTIEVLDVVALAKDRPADGLVRGQVGTVVEALSGDQFEVEFSDDQGKTYAMLPLAADELDRPPHRTGPHAIADACLRPTSQRAITGCTARERTVVEVPNRSHRPSNRPARLSVLRPRQKRNRPRRRVDALNLES